jgi:hypothetical protein
MPAANISHPCMYVSSVFLLIELHLRRVAEGNFLLSTKWVMPRVMAFLIALEMKLVDRLNALASWLMLYPFLVSIIIAAFSRLSGALILKPDAGLPYRV